MALKLKDCQATTKSITITLSEQAKKIGSLSIKHFRGWTLGPYTDISRSNDTWSVALPPLPPDVLSGGDQIQLSISNIEHGSTVTAGPLLSDFPIQVIGPPGAPGNINAVAGDGAATVTFDPPSQNGGSDITLYTIQTQPAGGNDQQVGSNATSRAVTGLANGTPYTFTVSATNTIGEGPISAPSSAATPFGLPGAPTGVDATAGHGQVVVTFAAAKSNGAPITAYTVDWLPHDGQELQPGSAATVHVLTGLKNGVTYSITVSAINAAGSGPASTMVGAVPSERAGAAPAPARALSVASNTAHRDARDAADGLDGHEHDEREFIESVEDVVAYPLLTEQVSFPSQAGGTGVAAGASAAPGGAALGQSVSKAVGDVLGWKVNTSDPKGFVGALTQSFTLTDDEGHVTATWIPRSYAVQTDLGGGLTGAQASLYTRAKDALDQALPLLDGLYPLNPDADPEYVKALREMARSQMTEIVKELGSLGGPSILRVNTYFGILLGQQGITFETPTAPQFDPDKVGGTLGDIRDVFGIRFQKNPFSNSIDDEQDITNFRVISDYMTSLLQSWISNGRFFELGTKQPAFFGTQLVLVSRQFSVIAETVSEVRFALDSVFIGPSERQTLLLEFDRRHLPSIFLEDMLNEIEAHVTTEGPRLLQDGGRISVKNNILPVLESFRDMVSQTHRLKNMNKVPKGFKTTRVQRTFEDLYVQLRDLITLIGQVGERIAQPFEPIAELKVLSTNVSTNKKASNSTLTIFGTGFERNAVVTVQDTTDLNSTIKVKNVTVASDILVAATVEGHLSDEHTYSLTVTNPDDEQRAVVTL